MQGKQIEFEISSKRQYTIKHENITATGPSVEAV
jgi:hypothetical protein